MFQIKKKMIIIISCVLVGVFSFSFKIANAEIEEELLQYVSTVPVSSKTVIIDAGHGLPDLGASTDSGVAESEINLEIALKVKALLEQSGTTVILTRSDEYGIYDEEAESIREKKISDIQNRVEIGNNSSADIFVSIHLNQIEENEYYGWQCFYKNGNEESINLATYIQNGLNDAIQINNTRVPLKIDGIYIVNNVEIPISIVECGFLSNDEELELLQDDNYQEQLAWGIYMGINDYFYNN